MSTELIIIIVLFIVIIAMGAIGFMLLQRKKTPVSQESTINEEAIRESVSMEKLQSDVTNLTKAVAVMYEQNKQSSMEAKNELHKITRVMTDKKSRGRYGEIQLETILNDAYGEQSLIIKKQHKMANGGLVDVAIDVEGQGLLPIDAKFPMEYYLKTLENLSDYEKQEAVKTFENQMKVHVKKVSDYIDEQTTTPFALIFIPSESMFADIQKSQSLLDYSAKSRVYFASPTSLLATVAVANQIKTQNDTVKNLPKILKGLRVIQGHMDTYKNSWDDVQKAIEKAYAKSQTHENSVNKVYNKADEILKSRDAKKLLEESDNE